MIKQLFGSIADSFRYRFGWPAHKDKRSDEYRETHDEVRRAFGRHYDARAVGGHTAGHPDGGRPFGRGRRD